MAKSTKADGEGEEAPPLTFEVLFEAYSNFGDTDEENVDGILLSQIDFWMKQAKLVGECVTLTDTGVLFNKFKKRRINSEEFEEFLNYVCDAKNLDKEELKERLFEAGLPTLGPKIG